MCPSYMVTREERYSTRGRSRLLFEMLRGEVIQGGWREDSVLEALDLCLSCKGCKGDCPVNVDMATYKAEFLSHYYQGRLRHRHAYAIGYIHRWAQLAAHFPRAVNFFAQVPILGSMAKFAAGISRHRKMPPFADEPFKNWFKRHRGLHSSYERDISDAPAKPEVILWADTFNNYFHPGTAQAAVEVLESAGCRVRVPRQNLCCGRPLYDYGMLDSAKKLLIKILGTLRAPIRAGVPVVVLEPSCSAVFRDELVNLFPNDEDAKRLSQQTFLLSEFLEKGIEDYQPPPMKRKAIVHGHCHHRAVMKMDAEEKILKKLGLDFQLLDSGYCGMAGGFGFEKEHYDVSIKAGERMLLPAVRQADPETLIIANGFSCREQISQTTDRKALHLAEIIQMAMPGEGSGAEDTRRGIAKQGRARAAAVGLAAGAMLLGGGLLWAVMRKRT